MSDGGPQSPLLLLDSPLGDDTQPIQEGTLHAIGLSAREALSRPFEARITAVSTQGTIDPDEVVGRPVCLTVRAPPRPDRFIHGVVRRLEASGMPRRGRWTYVLEVVPRLWFMGQAADCRVFQDRTAEEILRDLFAEHGVAPVEFRVYGDQARREYTTQYRETDLDFAHRLMQESGWFYFFEHERAAHKLVVSSRNEAFGIMADPEHRVVHAGNNVDVLDQWREAHQTAHGRVRLQDYDPARPGAPVSGEQDTVLRTTGAAQRRVFGWPAMTPDNRVAADRARFRIEASEAHARLGAGHGYNPGFAPGSRFTLEENPYSGAKGVEHVVHSVEHRATDDTWIAGGGGSGYENHFAFFRHSVPWRDEQTVPRPQMAGIFSAVVLGEDGEEIHADPMGRIKVRLLFDHRGETVAAKAVWARVVQPWAGGGWGWQHLPRVGTEVAVSFMNGDPDAPVVVGGFYHQEMPPVFPVPEQQTKQGFRSRSTPGGGTQDYSELSFDDREGKELVYLQAQKDHTVKVKGDYTLTSETGSVTIKAPLGIKLQSDPCSVEVMPWGISLHFGLGSLGVPGLQIGNTIEVGPTAIELKSSLGAVRVEAKAFPVFPPPNVVPPASPA